MDLHDFWLKIFVTSRSIPKFQLKNITTCILNHDKENGVEMGTNIFANKKVIKMYHCIPTGIPISMRTSGDQFDAKLTNL